MRICSMSNYTPKTLNTRAYNLQTFSSNHIMKNITSTTETDTVSFSGRAQMLPKEKLTNLAKSILESNNLQAGQKLYITGLSAFLPFLDILTEEAYKMDSGLISFKVIEPELEALKEKYNITEEFDYIIKEREDYKKANALFLNFDETNNPLLEAGLNENEIDELRKEISIDIPKEIRDLFIINPEEVLVQALDIHKGQPVSIYGEREHLPYITELVEWLYANNDTKLVNVRINNNNQLNLYKYGNDNLLEEVPATCIDAEQEMYDKDIALLCLDGEDPNFYNDVDSEKVVRNNRARRAAIKELRSKTSTNNPWLVYYAPTTKSCKEAYQDYDDGALGALTQAYKDANKINRSGKLEEHIKNLSHRAQKMNELIENGYRTLHYTSIDESGNPDGKTDFTIKMSADSIFNSARMAMPKYNHNPIVNIPTEEVFSAPLANTAQGVLSATKPLSLNGKLVEGIQFTFKDGAIVDIKATKNEDMLKAHIKAYENADRLGEIALVAGSPIEETGRIFNSVLLDENASCHFAIGDCYPDTIKGADEIEDYNELKAFLKEGNFNVSDTHNDFMVGGKNIIITAINDETGDTLEVIKDDKFLL